MDQKVLRPKIRKFGASSGKRNSDRLSDYTPSGDINTHELNNTKLVDGIELNEFEEEVHASVLFRLGHPTVRVELVAPQIKVCIDEAISLLDYHAPVWSKQMAVFQASAPYNTYQIPQYMANNLEDVIYKKSLLGAQLTGENIEFDLIYQQLQGNLFQSNFSIGEYYLMLQHLEMTRKVLNVEGSYDILDNQFLILYPRPQYSTEDVILIYRSLSSDTIQPFYKLWLHKYATASAKIILGQVRGKYSSLPSPAGGASLNGAQLIDEGKAEQETLKEELLYEVEEPPMFELW